MFLYFLQKMRYTYSYLWYISISGATTANSSLFTYDEGKSHSSYFDDGYVPIFLDQDDVEFDNATLGQQARDVCGDNKQCLFDIHTTGKISIGMASKRAVESFVAFINETETAGKIIKIFITNVYYMVCSKLPRTSKLKEIIFRLNQIKVALCLIFVHFMIGRNYPF